MATTRRRLGRLRVGALIGRPGSARSTPGQPVQDLVVLGKAPRLVFAVDQVSVGFDVENTALALDELGLDSEFVLDRFRQTGGLGQVVSLHAIGDRHVHRRFSCWMVEPVDILARRCGDSTLLRIQRRLAHGHQGCGMAGDTSVEPPGWAPAIPMGTDQQGNAHGQVHHTQCRSTPGCRQGRVEAT